MHNDYVNESLCFWKKGSGRQIKSIFIQFFLIPRYSIEREDECERVCDNHGANAKSVSAV